MAKIYFDNHSLDLARAKIFNSLVHEGQVNLFDVIELSSGDYLPKSKMEDGKYKVYGGGGPTQSTHTTSNVDYETIGIGRVGARCGCVFKIEKKSWVTDNALFVSKFKKKYDLNFLIHYLNHINLNQFANQSAQPVISQRGIARCTIPDIEFYKQQQIGGILGSIESGEDFEDLYNLKPVLEFEKNLSLLDIELNQQQTYLQLLRQTILQEAVQGKLTKENPTDEPATELLKRIKAEKEKLIKAGKLKKEKELPPITEDEIPFELPEGWVWCRLGDCGVTQTGATPPTNKKENFGDYIPFLGPADLNDGKVNYNNSGLSKIGLEKGRLIPKNSILMVCIGGSIGKSRVVEKDVSCNQQINTITCHKDICHKYLYMALASPYFQREISAKATGSATPIINKGKWESLPVPLPPPAEQQRIVAKVQQLQQQLSQLEAQVQQSRQYAQQLLQSVLREAFEEKGKVYEMEEHVSIEAEGELN